MSVQEPVASGAAERLHARAQELIRTGQLPLTAALNVYAGYGSGKRCQVCGDAIRHTEIEYELEFGQRGEGARTFVHLHLHCHAVWNHERMRAG